MTLKGTTVKPWNGGREGFRNYAVHGALVILVGISAFLILTANGDPPTTEEKIFKDVSEEAGVDVTATNVGVSWGDFSGDGRPDLFVANADEPSRLFRNNGGTFTDVSDAAGIGEHPATAALFIDTTGNMRLDLLVLGADGATLYRNTGNGFTDITAQSGLENITAYPDQIGEFLAASADIDDDGHLDLVVVHRPRPWSATIRRTAAHSADPFYFEAPSPAIREPDRIETFLRRAGREDLIERQRGRMNTQSRMGILKEVDANDTYFRVIGFPPTELRVFRNDGRGRFIEETEKLPAPQTDGALFQPVFFDYNRDGRIDLFLPADFLTSSVLLKNRGDFRFVDVSAETGVSGYPGGWMGADVNDINSDGRWDLFLTNVFREYDTRFEVQTNGTFRPSFRVKRNGIGWGTVLLDYDNDGRQDWYSCYGDFGGEVPVWEDVDRRNELYKNIGETFMPVTDLHINGDRQACWGVATADFSRNGFPDLFVANEYRPDQPGNGSILYRNQGNDNSWLAVRLQGTESNTYGVGSTIQVTAPGMIQTRFVTAGHSFQSQSSFEQLFGFGNYSGDVNVTVNWPSGRVQIRSGVQLNRRITITEQ